MERYLLLLCLVSVVWGACNDQLYVINSSPTGYPGDAINIQGGTFQSGSSAWLSSSTFANKAIRVLNNEGSQLISLHLPINIRFDKYAIQVLSGGKLSPLIYINNAIVQHADAFHVGTGANFRIFGRNLYYAGSTPQVVLKDSSGATYSCTVKTASSTAFMLSLTAPTTINNGVNYTIWITNGLGGATWSPLVATGIIVAGITATSDVYGLNVPWHGYFRNHKTNVITLSPSGTLDDHNAIRNALFSVAKPGEVYLTAGAYGLVGGIEIPANTVLRGAGKGATSIVYNHKYNSMTGGAGWVYFSENSINNGIADLSFTNAGTYAVNGQTNPLQVGSNVQHAFLKNLSWNMNITKHAFFNGIFEHVITDCDFTLLSTPSQNGNLWLGGNTKFAIFKNNVVTYDTWGIHYLSTTGLVIENNIIHRRAAIGFDFTTHVFATSWTSNFYFANNYVDSVNGRLSDNNDGETLLTEGGGAERGDIGAGKVSSATTTTLTDSTQNWIAFTTSPWVSIVSGPGLGQYRRIISNTANTLTVDVKWTITPTSASSYSFGAVAGNWTVYKNTFVGQERGIWLFMSYVYSFAIDSNNLTDSEGIGITTYTIDSNGPGSPIIATWHYGVQITNNYLSWDPSKTDARATYIGINHDQVRQDPVGVAALGVEIRRNQIRYLGGGTRGAYNDGYTNYDGYMAKVTNQGTTLTTLPNTVIGTIFQNNSISSFYSGLVLGESVSQTTVAFMSATSCSYTYRNVTINRADRTTPTDNSRATILSNYNLCF